jgi:xylose isomerase
VSETITATLPLRRWQGEKATYHLVGFTGDEADALSGHALMQKLEMGRRPGFGSVKVTANIGETSWKTSVFPQNKQSEWILLVSKKVMKAEDLAPGDQISVTVTPV